MSSKEKIYTCVDSDIIITRLTGKITFDDVNFWYQNFDLIRQQFLKERDKFKLLVDIRGYLFEHFTVRKTWKDKLYNKLELKDCIAIITVGDNAEVMNAQQKDYSTDTIQFSHDYDYAYEWLSKFKQISDVR
jgi:hypothetical protein